MLKGLRNYSFITPLHLLMSHYDLSPLLTPL